MDYMDPGQKNFIWNQKQSYLFKPMNRVLTSPFLYYLPVFIPFYLIYTSCLFDSLHTKI